MTEVEQLRMLLNETLNMHHRNLLQASKALRRTVGHRCDSYEALEAIMHRSRATLDTIKVPGSPEPQPWPT